jgi:hypothetical protein
VNGLVLALDAANTKSLLNTVEVLIVAGGGGGGSDMGGGGGGGGLIYASAVALTSTSYTITVGGGGAGALAGVGQAKGSNGGNTTAFGLTAIGGGGGASCHDRSTSPAGDGGSGGGASGGGTLPSGGSGGGGYGGGIRGLGTVGQGNNGGTGIYAWYPGGGGGAGAAGSTAPAKGGDGLEYNITGVSYFWAGGGGGSGYSGNGGDGGKGGGGGGAVGTTYGGVGLNNGSPGGGGSPNSQTNTPGGNAGANTGGGGGGGSHYSTNNFGGNGGSGIVIVRYPGVQRATGGTVTSIGGYTIHTFTTVGSSTFTPLSTWADLTRNSNNGTPVNGPTYSSANGGSIVFDGVDDYVTVPGNSGWAFGGNGAIEQWVYITGSDGNNRFWCVDNNPTSLDAYLSGSGYTVFFHGGGVGTTTNIPQNSWVHLLVTYTSGTIKVYFNAIEQPLTGTTTGYNITNSGTLYIARFIAAPYELTGRIAAMKIYNRALTAAEVSQNFNALRGRFGI